MNPIRQFGIQIEMVFFLIIQGTKLVKDKGAMVGLDILFVAIVG
jgi:hypothetical protein